MRIHRTFAVAAVLALAVAGCGGDDGDDAADRPPTTPTAEDATTGSDGSSGSDEADSGSSPSSGGAVEVCSLVSLDEAVAAVGVELQPDPDSSDDTGACTYSSVDPLDMTVVSITFQADGLSGTTLEQVAAIAGGMTGEITGDEDGVETVDGVGDGAFVLEVFGVPILYIGVGNDTLTVSVFGPDESRSAMIELGELAVSRL